MKRLFPAFFLILGVSVVFLGGCTSPGSMDNSVPAQEQTLINACIQACQNAKAQGTNLESGPCLLNPMPQNNSWVCDVAHNPRQEIDNLPENQCSAFTHGEANHFIEVTPNCEFIRMV